MWDVALVIAAVAMSTLVVFVIVGFWQVLGDPIAGEEDPGKQRSGAPG